ncbi:MAG: ribulose-phosphate 3-epimerase [Candidatus Yanofskybacteria bacterium]|nr:ribulose-phosphate 3-epimerase [Candidatus Yanofskybacteria bacterium]
MTEVIPSILVKTKEELLSKILAVETHVERIHLDIADGIFVPNMTMLGFEEVESLDTNLKIGVHLMVSKPENHIVRWLETPADKFIFHIEATNKAQEVIDAVKEADKTIGIAVNPQTPVNKIGPYIDQVDFVHFMTVEPGFYGGEFVESVVEKIKDFHFYYPDKPIEVDGGVTPETAPKLIEAGASMLVAGSYIWESKDIKAAIQKLQAATDNQPNSNFKF